MPFINCEFNLNLTPYTNCVLSDAANQAIFFAITDAKLYVSVVTLSTKNNVKLLQQVKSGFKSKIKWNKYQSKISVEIRNQYLA